MLQENQVLRSIRTAAVKKILSELEKMAQNTPEKYRDFYREFGICIKEGLYQDPANRESLLALVRYKSSSQEGLTSLAAYKERMAEGQKAIYYLAADREDKLRSSPLLEAYRRKGIEVLLMDDGIDELVAAAVGRFQDVELKAVNRSGAGEDLATEADKAQAKDLEPLLARVRKILGEEVKDVRASTRLADSACCVVMDDSDPSVQMQHLARALGQKDLPETRPILELNPAHDLVRKLQGLQDESLLSDVSRLLLEQALIQEGAELKNPAEFAKRLTRVLARAV
jgi:molecular chaperone HtpG